jgi:succinyl-diaminopimelate desuccinylase
MPGSERALYERELRARLDSVVELCAELVRVPSENPPGDTTRLASLIEANLSHCPEVYLRRVIARPPVVNLIAKLSGARPGRRLVINGHLDTFPAGDRAKWAVDPFGGVLREGRLYGRGAADMKAGIAAALSTMALMAEFREAFAGELVLTLVGDEETGARLGTQYLLAREPDAIGDAMINGDAGSPDVLRFGEKGQLWLFIEAHGRSHHGAHVHLGENAIEKLLVVLAQLLTLQNVDCSIPAAVRRAIRAAGARSERVSGVGETEALQKITVNLGTIEGGTSINLIPDRATARVDIRFPPGLSVTGVLAAVNEAIGQFPDVELSVLSSSEPNWTNPDEEIVATVLTNAATYLGRSPVHNMRLGFSDSRFYRYRAVPSVVYGPVPHNMGGPDEHVTVADLKAVFYVHAMTAFDYLTASSGAVV